MTVSAVRPMCRWDPKPGDPVLVPHYVTGNNSVPCYFLLAVVEFLDQGKVMAADWRILRHVFINDQLPPRLFHSASGLQYLVYTSGRRVQVSDPRHSTVSNSQSWVGRDEVVAVLKSFKEFEAHGIILETYWKYKKT